MPNPFFVLATQNPIEQEGTYPLPEAQLDRFLFLIKVDYPTDDGGRADHADGHVGHEGDASTRCSPARTSSRCSTSSAACRCRDKVFHFAKRITRLTPARHAGGGRLRARSG